MNTHMKDEEFTRIYNDKKTLVFLTAMRYSNNNYHQAQEITQDVFLKLYTNYDDKFDDDYLSAWLVTTARNAALNAVKKTGRELPDEDITSIVDAHARDISAEDTVFEEFYYTSSNMLSQTILDELYLHNERWYDIMTMVCCMGRKQKDVADKLGISLTVLQNTLYRARRWVEKHYGEDRAKLKE